MNSVSHAIKYRKIRPTWMLINGGGIIWRFVQTSPTDMNVFMRGTDVREFIMQTDWNIDLARKLWENLVASGGYVATTHQESLLLKKNVKETKKEEV